MLVLARNLGESIVIDNNITVTVLRKASGGIKLGFKAPREVVICRKELFGRITNKEQAGARRSFGGGMLVLTRLVDEIIKIGNDIEIKVLSITPKLYTFDYEVKLGISAPKNILINRKEIQEKSS